MKGILLELVMSFFKAAEAVKALRWPEFRSALEITGCIKIGFVDQNTTATLAFWASLAILSLTVRNLTVIHSQKLALAKFVKSKCCLKDDSFSASPHAWWKSNRLSLHTLISNSHIHNSLYINTKKKCCFHIWIPKSITHKKHLDGWTFKMLKINMI